MGDESQSTPTVHGQPATRGKVFRVVGISILSGVTLLIVNCAIFAIIVWAEQIPPRPSRGGFWSWQDAAMYFVAMFFGVLTAQLLLAVVYSSLGDGNSPKRVLCTTFVVTTFGKVMVLFTTWWFEVDWDFPPFFLLPVLLFFVLQIPLWGMRSFCGWRLVSPGSELSEPRRMRFSLSHVLGWSAFLSVPLCILQIFVEDQSKPIVATLLVLFLWTLMIFLLLLWFLYVALASDLGLMRSMNYGALILIVAVAIQAMPMSLSQGSVDFEAVTLLLTLNLSTGFVMLMWLRIARRWGFRLMPFAATKRLDARDRSLDVRDRTPEVN